MSHTGGPWFVNERFHVCRIGKDGRTINVATVNARHETYDDNARLIAAAPTMFEILKGMTTGKTYDGDKLRLLVSQVEGAE